MLSACLSPNRRSRRSWNRAMAWRPLARPFRPCRGTISSPAPSRVTTASTTNQWLRSVSGCLCQLTYCYHSLVRLFSPLLSFFPHFFLSLPHLIFCLSFICLSVHFWGGQFVLPSFHNFLSLRSPLSLSFCAHVLFSVFLFRSSQVKNCIFPMMEILIIMLFIVQYFHFSLLRDFLNL